jgi:hypothetical protein
MTIAVGELLQVTFFCTAGTQTSVNVRQFLVTAVTGVPTEVPFLAAVNAIIAPHFKNILSSAATFYGSGLTKLRIVPPPTPVYSAGSRGTGNRAAALLPTNDTGLITLRTAFGGRSYRGRIYLPFPASADNDNTFTPPSPVAAYLTNASTLAADFVGVNVYTTTDPATVTGQWVVYSRRLNAANFILSTVARPAWASQRRRGILGRTNPPPF